jgi:hypothetical protein
MSEKKRLPSTSKERKEGRMRAEEALVPSPAKGSLTAEPPWRKGDGLEEGLGVMEGVWDGVGEAVEPDESVEEGDGVWVGVWDGVRVGVRVGEGGIGVTDAVGELVRVVEGVGVPEGVGVADGVGLAVGDGAARETVPFESTSTDTGTPASAESGVVEFAAARDTEADTAVAFSHAEKRAWRDGDWLGAERPDDSAFDTKSATARLVAFAYAAPVAFDADAHAAGSVMTTRTVTYVTGTVPVGK